MEDKALTLRQELPRLIEAAKALEATMLLMLLVNVDEELRKEEALRRQGNAQTSHS